MNYNEMTDFEINKLVAEKLDEAFLLPYIVTFNDSNEVVYLCEKDGISSIYPIAHFDPCNNPSDAWPIILENNIKLYIDDEYDDVGNLVKSCNAYTGTQASSNTEYGKFNVDHKNPLRAAMIVYLMMGDE